MANTFELGYEVVGRYRLDEVLGVGRTTEVYIAEDLTLSRSVVIKILRPHLSSYDEVRQRFKDRVVRAAAMSHPHIARVFDGGSDQHHLYLVTEYLAGGSLEEFLARGERLSIEEAARLGRDVADALADAHGHGFVHAGLTPGKILFDDEGHVRVEGIALAGIADEFREPLSIRDARYVSPEQARGERPTSLSDVYSLGLILFECVTGEVAFDGSTPEEALRARLENSLPLRSELGTLDMVLAQAATPITEYRLQAAQFAGRLGAVVHDLSPFVRPGLAAPTILGGYAPSDPRTTIGFRAPSPDAIAAAPRPSSRRPRPDGTSRPPRDPELSDFNLERSGRRRVAYLVTAIVLALSGVGLGVAYKAGLFTSHHTVPSLINLSAKEAAKVVADDGYVLSVSAHVHSSTVALHDIVSQSPSAGVSAASGTTISVTVSDGPRLVTLPTSLVGIDCVSATAQLAAVHVNAQCPSTSAVYSDTTPAGRVAEVTYNGTLNPLSVPYNATVILALSQGPNPNPVTTTTQAGTTTTTSSTTTTVKGVRYVTVPNLVGMTRAQVNAAMFTAGLYYTTTGPLANTTKWTHVTAQNIPANTKVKYLSSVRLTVA